MDAPPATSPASANPLNALLAPALSSLASDLATTPAELADWLCSPELTDKLAALITNLESLEHLRALAARAPALSACRSLLATDNPVEQRRVAATLLRTPIHAPRRPPQTRSASLRSDAQSPPQPRSARTPPPSTRAASHSDPTPAHDLESLLSLLLTSPTAPPPSHSPAHAHPPGDMLATPDRPEPELPTAPPAPVRPATPASPPLALPAAPSLHRRTPPSRAAALLSTAALCPPPTPRPP